MQFSGPLVLLTLLIAATIFSSCSSPNQNSANSTNAAGPSASSNRAATGPKDNVEEFMILFRLPFEPEEVTWKENAEKKTLVAVLRFSPENTAKMTAEAAKNGQPADETLTVETWYPAELIAQGDLTGESILKGRAYPADAFLNPPYTKGRITHIENTDYFILQASS